MNIFIESRRKEIILAARSCMGSPFRHQGRSPVRGVDCVGLVIYVGHQLGLMNFDRTDYRKRPAPQLLKNMAGQAGFQEISLKEALPGDIYLLKFGRFLEHAAIISDRGIIHAYEKLGRVVEHGLNEDWRRRIVGAYRYPNMD